MTALWRNRDFTVLWGGQVVSTLGAQVSGTAMPLLVLATTGSPADAGLVGAAGTLPFLVANLPAGPLVDRWDRRKVLLVSEVVAGLAMGSVPVAMWLGVLTVTQLVVAAFAQGLCLVFFGLAERAALPLIVPAAQLPTAIAQNEARGRGAGLAGPPLGGLLFGLGAALPFLADAVSYALSAIGLLFVRRRLNGGAPPEDGGAPPEPLLRAALTGLRWVWRHPFVRTAILLIAASNLVFQALLLVLVVLAQRRHAGPGGVGLMLGIYSGGGLAGALAAARLHRHLTARTVIVGVNWVWAALLPLFAVAAGPVQIGLVGAACAFVGPLWNVVVVAEATLLVPNELLGRVTGAAMTMSWGVMPLASLLGGYLTSSLGPVGALWPLEAVLIAAAVAALRTRMA
ncbi:MFS transporter [Dactylosporangium sp. NPDC051485]|uniref:MFS transporter n=1 Tax=Dactylosporangium sp. NPDC051485 TaxID=3154846 RepID=UPI00343A05E9